MNKKKIIIISFVTLIVVAGLLFVLLNNFQTRGGRNQGNQSAEIFEPDFLTSEEKAKFDIPAEVKVQSLSRDENGEVMVYRIIRNESDIVDPDKIMPISPRK